MEDGDGVTENVHTYTVYVHCAAHSESDEPPRPMVHGALPEPSATGRSPEEKSDSEGVWHPWVVDY